MTVKTRLVPPLVVRRRSEDINTPPSTADAKLFANQRSCHCKENLQPPPHHTIKNLDHVKLILKSLHWLPVRARIQYKISTLCFNVITGTGPQYFSELLTCTHPLEIFIPPQIHTFSKFLVLIPKHLVRDHSHMSVALPGPVYHTVSAILTLRRHLDRL